MSEGDKRKGRMGGALQGRSAASVWKLPRLESGSAVVAASVAAAEEEDTSVKCLACLKVSPCGQAGLTSCVSLACNPASPQVAEAR
ncbi:hypothetical protein ElyMa_003893600 [Elysia marginata]|uniref:Uncharacterized protein n=1 Tax=Elysia marginata TaxID=1093978 RepID=A0AAV4FQ15_9GAST|nr:hypothetical protein ElyMa_003893600 [Elysia marginata]